MTCFNPVKGYRPDPEYNEELSKNGFSKKGIVFRAKDSTEEHLTIPCGKCEGCKKDKSREWAIRCELESRMHKNNCMITLTYNNENLPFSGSLVPRHLKNFIKYVRNEYGEGIRFFGCGEYGENLSRPHYHILFFNLDPADKRLSGRTKKGHRVYESDRIGELWKKGFHNIGQVNFKSVSYVARYVMKKVSSEVAEEHYLDREPEFTRCSLRPGIGRPYYEEKKEEIWNHDYVIIGKRKIRPPKYFMRLLEKENPDLARKINKNRKNKPISEDEIVMKAEILKRNKQNSRRSYEN